MGVITKTGDGGYTGLSGGMRVLKSDPRVVAYGLTDWLNSELGMIVSSPFPETGSHPQARPLSELLERMLAFITDPLQQELFTFGAILATPRDSTAFGKVPPPRTELAIRMEEMVVAGEALLPKLRHFIMPRGNLMAGHAHVARTVCRHVESQVVGYFHEQKIMDQSPYREMEVTYNRISDFCFVLARVANNVEQYDGEQRWFPRRPAEASSEGH